MSIFSKFFDSLKKIWSKIKTTITDLAKFIADNLAYLVIIAAVFLLGDNGFLLYTGQIVDGVVGAMMLMGAAFLHIPSMMGDALSATLTAMSDIAVDVVEAVSPVVTAVGEAIGSAAGELVGSFFSASGLLPILAIAGLSYFILSRDNTDKDKDQKQGGSHATL